MSRRASERSSQAEGARKPAPGTAAPASRKPYLQPALQPYGKLVDVTGFGGSQLNDSGVGSLQNP